VATVTRWAASCVLISVTGPCTGAPLRTRATAAAFESLTCHLEVRVTFASPYPTIRLALPADIAAAEIRRGMEEAYDRLAALIETRAEGWRNRTA